MARFVLCHGWGFDAGVWAPLIAALSAARSADLLERGYFGAEPAGLPAETGPVIAITHSLGTMTLLREQPPLSALIVINGFPCFTAAPDYPYGVAPRILSRMQRRFADDPLAVLAKFRARAGGAPLPRPTLDRQRLSADLSLLADGDMRPALATLDVPILVLAAKDDPIVSSVLTETAFADLPSTEIVWADGGGHALPWQRTAWCAAQITRFLAG